MNVLEAMQAFHITNQCYYSRRQHVRSPGSASPSAFDGHVSSRTTRQDAYLTKMSKNSTKHSSRTLAPRRPKPWLKASSWSLERGLVWLPRLERAAERLYNQQGIVHLLIPASIDAQHSYLGCDTTRMAVDQKKIESYNDSSFSATAHLMKILPTWFEPLLQRKSLLGSTPNSAQIAQRRFWAHLMRILPKPSRHIPRKIFLQ